MSEYFESDSRIATAWQALKLFSFYRIVLSGFLWVLILSGNLPEPFGNSAPDIFSTGIICYLAASIFLLFFVKYQRPVFGRQVYLQISVDFIAFGVLMYASGGVGSGIGLLLVISVAAGSLLLVGSIAYLFAAIGAIVILCVEMMVLSSAESHVTNFTQAGLLGGVLFATASLSHVLAGRIRESEALAAKRGQDLESLSRMNARIVQRMRSGLLVLDSKGIVHLANVAATSFLGLTGKIEGSALSRVAPELHEYLKLWLRGQKHTSLFSSAVSSTDIQVSFTFLSSDKESDILIFMEDAATMRQNAQHLKLASLGQLTASIAHEIRNPLGAISHAGQLLSESPQLAGADLRLLQIINDHSSRVNQIIENILKLGRRDNSIPESFMISPWLEEFITEFRVQHDVTLEEVIFSVNPENTRVTMDQSQLHQILTNLCENALRYSTELPKIEVRCSVNKETERPYLEVIDSGPGIKEEQVDQIFEPFFTDHSAGTGLGLYIASELCEANQALLALHKNTEKGCSFRITFAHPNKQIHID